MAVPTALVAFELLSFCAICSYEVVSPYGTFDTSYRIVADWEMMLRWWLNDVVFVATNKTLANFRMGGVSSEHLKKC